MGEEKFSDRGFMQRKEEKEVGLGKGLLRLVWIWI